MISFEEMKKYVAEAHAKSLQKETVEDRLDRLERMAIYQAKQIAELTKKAK